MRYKIMLSIILTILVPFSVMAESGLTKELLFKGLRKEMKSRIITQDFIKNPSAPAQIKLGSYYELETKNGRLNSNSTVKEVLKNSYDTDLHPKVCGDTTYGNNVMFFFKKLDGIHKFYSAKHFCGVLGSGCSSQPAPSVMITHDEMEMETIEDECPALAKLYKDYETFADTTIKKLYEYTKKKVAGEQQKQEDVRLEKQRQEEDRKQQAELKVIQEKQAEVSYQRHEEERRKREEARIKEEVEELEKRKEEGRKQQQEQKLRRERDRAEMAKIQREDAERAKKKREDEARKKREQKKALKAGKIPIKSVDDAALYYDAAEEVEGFQIIAQTPLRPDNKYYVVGGVITRISTAKSGRMIYSGQVGQRKAYRFHFQFQSEETESNANLRRNHYTRFVGRFIKLNSIGEPIFMMYYSD
jgi:hypothetical protein